MKKGHPSGSVNFAVYLCGFKCHTQTGRGKVGIYWNTNIVPTHRRPLPQACLQASCAASRIVHRGPDQAFNTGKQVFGKFN